MPQKNIANLILKKYHFTSDDVELSPQERKKFKVKMGQVYLLPEKERVKAIKKFFNVFVHEDEVRRANINGGMTEEIEELEGLAGVVEARIKRKCPVCGGCGEIIDIDNIITENSKCLVCEGKGRLTGAELEEQMLCLKFYNGSPNYCNKNTEQEKEEQKNTIQQNINFYLAPLQWQFLYLKQANLVWEQFLDIGMQTVFLCRLRKKAA